jgi:hypothetical protein
VFGQCGCTGKWWSLVGNIDSLSSACSFTGGFTPWGARLRLFRVFLFVVN